MNMIIASARAYSVRAEYLSAGERFAVEEFTLEVVDGLDAYSIAFARADESAYADARVQRIYGGTNEIMKEIISRTL